MKPFTKLLNTFLTEKKELGVKIALRHTYYFLLFKWRILISYNQKLGILGAEIRRMQLSREIDELLTSKVKYGLFAGLRFDNRHSWIPYNRGNMLLGLYEKEVVTSIASSSHSKDYFIDIGAADGYFGLGVLTAKLFKHSYVFESSSKGQEIILANAVLNDLTNQISVYPKAELNFLDNISESHVKNSVVLIDIEGAEFELLSEYNLEKLRDSHLIIELHHEFVVDGLELLEKLRERVNKWFKIEILETSWRDLSKISEISKWSDTDRWILCSEGRPMSPIWWKLTPH